MLQKVGIPWPGSPELPEEPRELGAGACRRFEAGSAGGGTAIMGAEVHKAGARARTWMNR